MVTITTKEERQIDGRMYYEYKSYLFGGLVKNDQGICVVSNDLFEIRTKSLISAEHCEDLADSINKKPSAAELHSLMNNSKMNDLDQAIVIKIQPSELLNKGVMPQPRRDHSAVLINKNTRMLVYGGKNDQAKQINHSATLLYELSDIFILDLFTFEWIAVY